MLKKRPFVVFYVLKARTVIFAEANGTLPDAVQDVQLRIVILIAGRSNAGMTCCGCFFYGSRSGRLTERSMSHQQQ